MRGLRFVWAAFWVAAGAASAAELGALGSEPAALERVQGLLAAHPTKAALTRYVGHPPFACAAVAEERAVCSWKLGDEHPRWPALAATVPTKEAVNLVCEVAEGDVPRAPDSCSVHPRRSNRGRWKVNRGLTKMDKVERPWEKREAEERRQRAQTMFDEAKTPLAVSRLVGEGPVECSGIGTSSTRCMWYTTAETYGHGTLLTMIDAHPSKKILMECVFPRDGGARAPGSCVVAIGAEP